MLRRPFPALRATAAALALGLLLVAGAVLGAGDDEARAAATTTGRLMIAPAAFTPSDDSYAYFNDGHVLDTVGAPAGTQCFVAPVEFPVDMPTKKVRINRVFMWAGEDSASREATLSLVRTVPGSGPATLGSVTTADSPAPQKVSFRGEGAPVFLWNNVVHLEVCLSDSVFFYGAAINYSYTT